MTYLTLLCRQRIENELAVASAVVASTQTVERALNVWI